MDNPNQFSNESRRELRKRKTMNRLLNTAIGVVVVLIGFFLFALLFQDDEPVADDEFEDEEDADIGFEEEEQDEEASEGNEEESSSGPEEAPDNGLDVPEDESGENEENGESEEGTETEEEGEDNGESTPSPPEDGDYEPIGTEQEDFSHDFDSDSQNWNEMVMAMEYATGTSEEDWSHIEWIGNDGPEGAEGTFVHDDGTEYTVTMEWVDDEGWMPTNVDEN